MKKLLLICTIILPLCVLSAQTKLHSSYVKAKELLTQAQTEFDQGNYQAAINRIKIIDKLMEGVEYPDAQNLKIKSLIGLKKFDLAKKELDVLYDMELEDSIIDEIVNYQESIKNKTPLPIKKAVDQLNDNDKGKELVKIEPKQKENLSAKKKSKLVDFRVIEKAPIYPGCSGNNERKAKCFNKNVAKIFAENFDSDLPNELGLTAGRKRIFMGFIISESGEIKNIIAKSPHPELTKEAIRVLNLLPRMTPGFVDGVPVEVKFSFPMAIDVQ